MNPPEWIYLATSFALLAALFFFWRGSVAYGEAVKRVKEHLRLIEMNSNIVADDIRLLAEAEFGMPWISIGTKPPEPGARVECWVTDRLEPTHAYPDFGVYEGFNEMRGHRFSVANDRHAAVTHWRPASSGPLPIAS